tara:strand:- start:2360 stop:2665 length:306 start_codon:yes stop_codon:yes gene_type:complete
MRDFVLDNWSLVMDHNKNPLCNIPSLSARHMIMQVLAWMWVIVFTIASGTWAYAGMNVIVHTVLIAGTVLTVAVFEAARRKPNAFNGFQSRNGRANGGEHE